MDGFLVLLCDTYTRRNNDTQITISKGSCLPVKVDGMHTTHQDTNRLYKMWDVGAYTCDCFWGILDIIEVIGFSLVGALSWDHGMCGMNTISTYDPCKRIEYYFGAFNMCDTFFIRETHIAYSRVSGGVFSDDIGINTNAINSDGFVIWFLSGASYCDSVWVNQDYDIGVLWVGGSMVGYFDMAGLNTVYYVYSYKGSDSTIGAFNIL